MSERSYQHKVGIVGLGSIFEHQYKALALLPESFQVTSLCDINRCSLDKACNFITGVNNNSNVESFGNIEDLLEFGDIDTIIVATPPSTHFELVRKCLEQGKNVILEKPAVLIWAQLEDLVNLAHEKNLTLYSAFHAAFAPEVLWYRSNMDMIRKKYAIGNMVKIEHCFYDNYVVDGILIKGKETLGGSYIDSSVNELSVAASLVDLQNYKIQHISKECLANTETVCRSKLILVDQQTDMTIECDTDWTLGVNKKQTQVFYDDGTIVTLDHSSQFASLSGQTKKMLFAYSGELSRLVSHYYCLFKDAAHHLKKNMSNGELSLKIHKVLLE